MSLLINIFMQDKERSKKVAEQIIDTWDIEEDVLTTTNDIIDLGYVKFFLRDLKTQCVGVRGHVAIVPDTAWMIEDYSYFIRKTVSRTLNSYSSWFRENGFDRDSALVANHRRDSTLGVFNHNGNLSAVYHMIDTARMAYSKEEFNEKQ